MDPAKGSILDLASIIQYLYVANNPLINIDSLGLMYDRGGASSSSPVNEPPAAPSTVVNPPKSTGPSTVVDEPPAPQPGPPPILEDEWESEVASPVRYAILMHFTDDERETAVKYGIIASLIIDAGDSAAIILQALVETGNFFTAQDSDIEIYLQTKHNLAEIDSYFLSRAGYPDSYYLGKSIGDAIAAAAGIGLSVKNIVKAITGASAAAGGTITGASGVGLLVASAGVALTAEGIAEAAGGISLASAAVSNFGDNFGNYDYYDRLRCEGSEKRPDRLSIDKKQLGRKYGEHFDSSKEGYRSSKEYEDFARDIFDDPDAIYYDGTEYYYTKGTNLLRVKPDGSFVSLYPGADSDRVIKAVLIYKK